MYRLVLALAMVAACAAYTAPSMAMGRGKKVAIKSSGGGVTASPIGLVGADLETGFFDPWSLSADRSPETIAWYRQAEIKHARVAMLACAGLWVGPTTEFPVPPYDDPIFSATSGLGALQQLCADRPAAIVQVVLVIAAVETLSITEPSIYSNWDPLNLIGYFELDNKAKMESMQLRELKNGRLAMIAFMGMLAQEGVSGQGVWEQMAAGNMFPVAAGAAF
jgi:light-harvesting complex I chlorophyll a/b binding protein 4